MPIISRQDRQTDRTNSYSTPVVAAKARKQTGRTRSTKLRVCASSTVFRLAPVAGPLVRQEVEDADESLFGEVGRAGERLELWREPHAHWPTPPPYGGLNEVHKTLVYIRSLLAVYLPHKKIAGARRRWRCRGWGRLHKKNASEDARNPPQEQT